MSDWVTTSLLIMQVKHTVQIKYVEYMYCSCQHTTNYGLWEWKYTNMQNPDHWQSSAAKHTDFIHVHVLTLHVHVASIHSLPTLVLVNICTSVWLHRIRNSWCKAMVFSPLSILDTHFKLTVNSSSSDSITCQVYMCISTCIDILWTHLPEYRGLSPLYFPPQWVSSQKQHLCPLVPLHLC